VFIERSFQVHGLQLPEVIVSDDDVAKRGHVSLDWRVKPGTFQLTLARTRLARLHGESLTSPSFHDRSGFIYFGDDDAKDGGLARAANICFGHYDPQASVAKTADGFRFPTWKYVQDRFL
jgi:hypothetical protein